MKEVKTRDLDALLKQKSLKDIDALLQNELSEDTPSLSAYLEQYLTDRNLDKGEVIRQSLLSRDYAYAIFNGNRLNPTRDRIIALCLAMHMDPDSAQRALRLCHAGELYAKDKRDALIIIALNTKQYDIMALNSMLHEHELPILQTSKDAF